MTFKHRSNSPKAAQGEKEVPRANFHMVGMSKRAREKDDITLISGEQPRERRDEEEEVANYPHGEVDCGEKWQAVFCSITIACHPFVSTRILSATQGSEGKGSACISNNNNLQPDRAAGPRWKWELTESGHHRGK